MIIFLIRCRDDLREIIGKLSIKNKIFIINIFIISLSLFMFAYYTEKISTKAIVSKAINNSRREMQLIDGSISNIMNDTESYSRILSSENRLRNILQKIQKDSNEQILDLEIKSVVSDVLSNIVDPNSRIIAGSIMSNKNLFIDVGGVSVSSIYKNFSSDFIGYVQKNRKPIWTSLIKIKMSNGKDENVFAIAKSIIDKDKGTDLGLAVLYMDERDIADIYTKSLINKNDRFYLINDQGIVISSKLESELYLNSSDVIEGINKIKDNETYKIFEYDKQSMLINVHKFSKLNWKMVSIVALNEITIEKKDINKAIFIIGLICLFFAFSTSLLVSNAILKPLKNMVNVMKNIEKGKLDLRVETKKKDELGHLEKGFNKLMDKIEELVEAIYEEQKKVRGYEYKLIQAQVNPHFLYNTIETFISLVTLDMKTEAITSAKNLANFYRISLSNGKDLISIHEELSLCKAYLAIMEQRYSDYMDFDLEFQESILNNKIPKLSIQPLAENAIYHGLKTKNQKGKLTVKCYSCNNNILIEVLDNGVGMSQEKIQKVFLREGDSGLSFGIKSVNARIKLLFGADFGVRIESEIGKYTKMIITLPVVD